MVKGHQRNISVKLFLNRPIGHGSECRFTGFSILSSGGHFAQRREIFLAILVEGHPRNISVKLF